MQAVGFDNQKYLKTQSEQIQKRIAQFGGKLYLEFGGKLFDDYHASRVLPGFQPDSKIRMLQKISDDVEIVIAINAADIEKNKVRGDLGITYDEDVLRLIDTFRSMDLYVGSVVLTRYSGQPAAAICARIWCVRPVRFSAASSLWAFRATSTIPLQATPPTLGTSSATRVWARTITSRPAAP